MRIKKDEIQKNLVLFCCIKNTPRLTRGILNTTNLALMNARPKKVLHFQKPQDLFELFLKKSCT